MDFNRPGWRAALAPAIIAAAFVMNAPAQELRPAARTGAAPSLAFEDLRASAGRMAAPAVPEVPAPGAAPDWSLLVYAAVDSDDLEAHADAALRELLEAGLPENAELLMETDAYGDKPVRRTIRRGTAPPVDTVIPEQDSAAPETLERFLEWANASAWGRRRMLLVITHSWGWKGIIQDFTLPGGPGDTMMPLPEFSRILRKWPSDVLFLDSCVLGNAEVLEELKGTAEFIVASQRETPYGGFPYAELLGMLASAPEPGELARDIPEKYVSAYARGGARAAAEGSYDIVTAAAVDMRKWAGVAPLFRELTAALGAAGFRKKLAADPAWPQAFADEDGNVDLYELLTRLRAQSRGAAVRSKIAPLLAAIGYPEDLARESAETVELDPAKVKAFEAAIEADEQLEAGAALETLRRQWEAANLDLDMPDLQFELSGTDGRERRLIVRGSVLKPASIRVWLPGTRRVELGLLGPDGTWTRAGLSRSRDYFSAARFPAGSFLLSEAHSQGAPFIHGIGVNMKPLMDDTEVRAEDPVTGLKGPGLYRAASWNRATGWGDLILLK